MGCAAVLVCSSSKVSAYSPFWVQCGGFPSGNDWPVTQGGSPTLTNQVFTVCWNRADEGEAFLCFCLFQKLHLFFSYSAALFSSALFTHQQQVPSLYMPLCWVSSVCHVAFQELFHVEVTQLIFVAPSTSLCSICLLLLALSSRVPSEKLRS